MGMPPLEESDLHLVADDFESRGLATERFSAVETRTGGKTPDFKVLREGVLVAYCEVKSPHDSRLADKLTGADAFRNVGFVGKDTTFNKLSRQIVLADRQFTAVNPGRTALNILALVNHDRASYFGDLQEVLTGYFPSENGDRHPTMLHIADGRLGECKRRIDLFLWFDAKSEFAPSGLITDEPHREEQVRLLFGVRADAKKDLQPFASL